MAEDQNVQLNQDPPVDLSPEEIGSPIKAAEEIGEKISEMITDPAAAAEKQMPTAPINTDVDPLKGLDPVHHEDVMPHHTASDSVGTAVGVVGDPNAKHSDTLAETTTFRGRTLPYPLYTTVFFVLAALTAVEVALTVVLGGFFLTPILLVLISVFKAVLVVAFYMHLREDSRLFAIALGLPVIIASVAVLFLLSVPTTGY